jgi:uncharacterized membrane protein
MAMAERGARVDRDTARAEAFSDAVLAIIITLLALDLFPAEWEPGRLLPALVDQWPTYLAYVTSYLYVAVIWLNHKATFARIRHMDRRLHWANLGTLATTALLPLPTSVISATARTGNLADERTAVGLYAVVGSVLCLSWLWFFHELHHRPHLVLEDVDSGFFRSERQRALVGVVAYAVAGLVGVAITPLLGSAILLALPIFYGVTSHGYAEAPAFVRRAFAGRRRQP